MLPGGVGEEDEADGEAGNGEDEEGERRPLDPDKDPPRDAVAWRAAGGELEASHKQ